MATELELVVATDDTLGGVAGAVTMELATGIPGPAGADGAAGPNTVTGSTTTTLTGLLTGNGSVVSAVPTTTYQPLDSDLTAIAALTTTAYGRGFLPIVDAAAARTYLGLGTAATQASSAFAAASHTHPLSPLTQSGATTGQVASWNGSAWAPATVSGGGGGTWGSITGTLSSQTDLQTALDAKANTSSLGALATLNAAPAGTLTGSTLASGVTVSSLTRVGDSLGIGVTPAYTLHLRSAGNAEVFIDAAGGIPILRFARAGTPYWTIYQNASDWIGFGRFGAAECLQLTNADRVGVGANAWVDQSSAGRLSVGPGSAAGVAVVVRGESGQTGDLLQLQNSASSVLTAFRAGGGWQPASMSDASAPNNTVYFSTTASKLVYKDSTGTVNNLY
jgi:hypothetical protein